MPFGGELDGVRHAIVAGAPRADTALVVSNWPGVRAPAAMRADTSTEMVLALLRSSRRDELLAGVEAVSCPSFGADGLLAMWALLEPEAALARAERLTLAARAGSFGVYRESEPAYVACWVKSYPEEMGLRGPEACYRAMLPLVREMLDDPRSQDLYWIGEYSDIIRAESMLASGAVQIEEHPELDLAVMETPIWLHDLTRLSATGMFRLLTVRSENTYTLEYRLESWVQYRSRRVLPRIDLRPLAARLNLFERYPGTWRAEPVDAPWPRLFLDAGDGRAAPSGIDAETVVAEVVEFFQVNARRRDLQWNPVSAPMPEA